jgi:gluconokinase
VATALAQRLGCPLQEGDELHPPAFAKIHSAHPLDDRDQWSWLAQIAAWIDGCRQAGAGGVITCSVLRRPSHFPTRGRPQVRVVYFTEEEVIAALDARRQFIPQHPSTTTSQFWRPDLDG